MDRTPGRSLTLLQAFAVIVGTVIGSGVFMNLPMVARVAGNPWTGAWIWLAGGLLWVPQVLVLAEMGTAYPDQGGPYRFLVEAGSPFLGFLYTWTAFLTSDTPTITIVALLAASAASALFPPLGDPWTSRAFAAALILSFAWIQSRGVRLGSRLQVLLTAFKLLPLLALVVLALLPGTPSHLAGPFPAVKDRSFFSLFTAGTSTTLWAYAGFLNILYMAGEVKRPSRNIPLSLLGSLLFITGAYVAIHLAACVLVPYDRILAVSPDGYLNPFAYLPGASRVSGPLFHLVFLVSMLALLNALVMTQPRLEYATAKDGLFFRPFARLHPERLTPNHSIWIQALLAILLFSVGNVQALVGYFTLSYVLQNALVYGALFSLRSKPGYLPAFKLKGAKAWAALAVAIQLYIAYGAATAFPGAALLVCAALILSGAPVYLAFRKTSLRG